MDIFDPPRAKNLVGSLDRPGDRFSGFNLGALDVDHAEPKSDFWAKVLEYLQLLGRTVRILHDDMIDMKAVEIIHQLTPMPFLHRLAAVVAETEVDGGRGPDGSQHAVDRCRGPLPLLGMAR